MLPIFDALTLEDDDVEGGTTRPWLVTVSVNGTGSNKGKPRLFLVKLFSKKDQEQYQPINKEIAGYLVAEQFELSAPRIALIRFGEEFRKTLSREQLERLDATGPGPKFGCEFIEGCTNYSSALQDSFFDRYDMELIFAFDVLVRNVDRRVTKPNILFKERDYFLIDHEQCLLINEKIIGTFDKQFWSFIDGTNRSSRHIFFDRLKQISQRNEVDFDTFAYYLERFDLSTLIKIKYQLAELNFETEDIEYMIGYLEYVKENQSDFIDLLKSFLS